MRRFKHLWATLLVAAALYTLFSQWKTSAADLPSLVHELHKGTIIFLILFQLLAYVGDGLLSKILLEVAGFRLKLKDTVKIAILDVLGGQVVPLIGGSVVTYYFYRKFNIPSSVLVFLVIVWTTFVWATYLIFFLGSLLFLPESFFSIVSKDIVVFILGGAAALALFLYVIFRNYAKNFFRIMIFFASIFNTIGKVFWKRDLLNPERVRGLISEFLKTFSFFKRYPLKFIQAFLAAALFYTADIATLYFSFAAFGFHPNLSIVIVGFVVSSVLPLLTLLPETPGVMEASLVFVFVTLGIPAHIALFGSLLFRLVSYWLPLPIGIISFLIMRKRGIL